MRFTTDLAELVKRKEKFATIYADPPWQYNDALGRWGADSHYSTMALDDIAALPVRKLAADDAHLHLWTTSSFLFEAKGIMESWGFEYRSSFVWLKQGLGLGRYWRVTHEFLLLGVRGALRGFEDNTLRSWEVLSRSRHSAKPDRIRKLIEKASPEPRLELFGRRLADGWTVWGNEVEVLPLLETATDMAAARNIR